MNLFTFRRKRSTSKYPQRPAEYTTPCGEFLQGRDGTVSVACLDAWRPMFDYLESKQDMLDIRDGLTAILDDDDIR